VAEKSPVWQTISSGSVDVKTFPHRDAHGDEPRASNATVDAVNVVKRISPEEAIERRILRI
jgi:hypothetical protein